MTVKLTRYRLATRQFNSSRVYRDKDATLILRGYFSNGSRLERIHNYCDQVKIARWFSLGRNHEEIFCLRHIHGENATCSDSGGSMTAKHFASTAMRAVRTGLVSTAIFQFAVGSAFAAAARRVITRQRDQHADQARDRHHWGKPQLRSRLRYLCTEERPDSLESSFRRNCESGWNAGAELPSGGTESTRMTRRRRLPVKPAPQVPSMEMFFPLR